MNLALSEKDKAVADRQRVLAEKLASDQLAQERAEEIARLRARLQTFEKTKGE